MSTRATVAAAIASTGVLGLGWLYGTAQGYTLPVAPTTDQPVTGTADVTTTDDTTSTQTTSVPSWSATATPSATAAAGSGSATSLTDGTYTGDTVSHRYGQVTVTVTIRSGAIASLSEQVSASSGGRSSSINAAAIPTLRQEILAADSARVDTVSGATYTSQAYLTSLQSALDEASA